jgi:outer membrane protein OmpA-like peptidoglycan-associated protein
MPLFWCRARHLGRVLLVGVLASAQPNTLPHWPLHGALAQTPSEACAAHWTAFEGAAKARLLEAAIAAESSLAGVPGCSRQRVAAREAMLGLYRDEADRLKQGSAPPARQLALLETALGYANASNAWDIHTRIGDLKRRMPAADGQPDHAAVSLAYDEALRAIDLAPPSARPATTEIERIVGLAYQYEALSPTPVPRRATFTRTVRQINVERTPVPLQFVYDSAKLTAGGLAQARNLIGLLKDEGMPPIRLIGHTDPKGSDAYNDTLSVRRAAAVRDFLIAGGYPADRIDTEGRGKRDIDKLKIVDQGDFTPDQIHQMLRRVELVAKP